MNDKDYMYKFEEPNNSFLKVSRSVCKLQTSNLISTGVFLKFLIDNNYFYCLMTAEYAISQDLIDKKEILNISYDYGFKNLKIKLDNNERNIKKFRDSFDSIHIK